MVLELREPGWFPVHNVDLTVSNFKQLTSATFAISRISSFTGASVRSMSVATDSIDVTAMRVGRALVYV